MEYKYNNGSLWRKWDFHVHTKGTNKNDQFKSETFDEFCIELFSEALKKKIHAIGITDYFSIDNYKRVIQFQREIDSQGIFSEDEKEWIKTIFIFPNVELRLLPTTDSGRLINFHCIFNPDYIEQLTNDFFSTLTHKTTEQEFKMNRDGISNLGKNMDSSLDEEAAYKKGIENFIVSYDKIKDLLDSNVNLRNNTITAVSNSSNDGASGLQKHYDLFENETGSLDSVRRSIYKMSHCVFSANPSDRDYLLGNRSDSSETVINKYGSLKPCIHGSDAHTESQLFNPDENRYCWVKADLSFEGLKQVICEPGERVRIQVDNPNTKKSYNIINKVRFKDNKEERTFTDFEIGLNPNLNAIIGGKSSGKSLLLHCIADKIGSKTDKKNYSSVIDNVEIEVFYADDPNTPITASDKRIIEFLPQLYIEEIVRERGTAETIHGGDSNQFNKFIEELIRQDQYIDTIYEQHIAIVEELTDNINSNITDWINKDKLLKRLKKELEPLGDKMALTNEIKRLENTIEELSKDAGLKDDDREQYKKLTKRNEKLLKRIELIQRATEESNRFEKYLSKEMSAKVLENIVFTATSCTISDFFKNIKSDIAYSLSETISSYKKKIKRYNERLSIIQKRIEKEIESNDLILKPLLDKTEIECEVQKIERAIITEKEKIKKIETKETEIEKAKSDRDEIEFITLYTKIFNSYKRLQDKTNQSIKLKWDEAKTNLKLTASSIFNTITFGEAIKSVVNVQSYLQNQFPDSGFTASNYDYDYDKHISNIKKILTKLIGDEDRFSNFKTGGDTETILRALLKDCFYIEYDITKSGDSLKTMSEGKKGIVILQLYLSLSNADCPILIDQPEDNLDNRTVFKELNDYIKDSKKRRQIIMVSHNANLVVNTDAENIIIANQTGEDGKENRKYRFEYVNGSLENTFPKNNKVSGILYQQGVKEHVCEILEGGVEAFEKREQKYDLKRS